MQTRAEDKLERLRGRLLEFGGQSGQEDPQPVIWQEIDRGESGLREVLLEAVRANRQATEVLEECRRIFSSYSARKHIKKYWSLQNCPYVDSDRIWRNALVMITTAQAASALKLLLAGHGEWRAFVAHWTEATFHLHGAPPSNIEPHAPSWVAGQPDVISLIDDASDQLVVHGWPVQTLKYWTLYWLDRCEFASRHHISMPIAGVTNMGGFMADLRFWRLDDAPAELVEHPETALSPFGCELVAVIRDQWRKFGNCGAVWSIRSREPKIPLDGPSLGAAASVGFQLIKTGQPFDPLCLIAARVDDDGSLRAVADELRKIQAATSDGIRKIAIADGSLLSGTDISVFEAKGVKIERVHDVSAALKFASGVASGLKRFLETQVERPDSGLQPAYLGHRRPTELYVEPTLLIRDPGVDVQRRLASGLGRLSELYSDSFEIGETGVDSPPTEHRASWSSEFQRLRTGTFRCAVVLGPPGQGKTQLIAMTARSLAEESLDQLCSHSVPLESLCLPVIIPFQALAKCKAGVGLDDRALRRGIGDFLMTDGCDAITASHISMRLHEPQMVLFLDGLDELHGSAYEEVATHLEVLSRWQCSIVITSRPYGYANWHLPFAAGAVVEYRLAAFDDFGMSRYVNNRFSGNDITVSALGRSLSSSASLRTLAQSPFLLTLLCAVQEEGLTSNDVTRSELYDRALEMLIGGPVRYRVWRRMLMELAWVAFSSNSRQPRLSGEELTSHLFDSEYRPPVTAETAVSEMEKAELRLGELLQRRILVPSDNGRSFVFPHRSLVEYLGAGQLAEQLQKPDQESWKLVDRCAWDPAWEEVVLFLIGHIADDQRTTNRVLALLSDAREDDMFRHRLGLAGRCLAEIPSPLIKRLASCNEVGSEILRISWEAFRKCDDSLWGSVTQALSAVGRAQPSAGGAPFCNWLRKVLESPERERALDMMLQMGNLSVSEEVLRKVIGLCRDPDDRVCDRASKLLAQVDLTDLAADIIAELIELRASPSMTVRSNVASVLRQREREGISFVTYGRLSNLGQHSDSRVRESVRALSNPLAGPGTLARFARDSTSQDPLVRKAVIEELWGLGQAANQGDVISRLLALLKDPDGAVRGAAAGVIGRLGTPVVRTARAELLDLCQNGDNAGRRNAVDALGKLDSVVGIAGVLEHFQRLSKDPDDTVRRNVAEAFGRLGLRVPHKDVVVEILLSLTGDPNWLVRKYAADSLGAIGNSAASPTVLSRLLDLYGEDGAWDLRTSALRAFNRLCGLGSRDDVIPRLCGLLGHASADVRRAAVGALGRLGSVACKPVIVARFLEMCRSDSVKEVRDEALAAIQRLGPGAATPDVTGFLLEIREASALRHLMPARQLKDVARTFLDKASHPAFWERSACAAALGDLRYVDGEVLNSLVALCRDQNHVVRAAAARALAKLGPEAGNQDVVRVLLQLAQTDSVKEVRERAMDCLAGLRCARDSREVVIWVLQLFEEQATKSKATNILRRFTQDGLRLFRRRGVLEIKSVEQLGVSNWAPAVRL